MAGSIRHTLTKKGKLRDPKGMSEMLENGGDVYEAIEEYFGALWYLAVQLDLNQKGALGPKHYFDEAVKAWMDGLKWSPGLQKGER